MLLIPIQFSLLILAFLLLMDSYLSSSVLDAFEDTESDEEGQTDSKNSGQ